MHRYRIVSEIKYCHDTRPNPRRSVVERRIPVSGGWCRGLGCGLEGGVETFQDHGLNIAAHLTPRGRAISSLGSSRIERLCDSQL
jgi:hypothetical protein